MFKMKTLIIFFILILGLFTGCDSITDSKIDREYSITVTTNNVQSVADVMFVFDNGEDSIISTDINGLVKFKTDKVVLMLVGMKLGHSGVKQIKAEEKIVSLQLENVEITSFEPDWTGTFGVYSTNSDGDVTFKYQGNFINYYCSSYLPYLGESTNPNNWVNWNLTEFTFPWKGKKLLVPRRYQSYHRTVYGFSISQALFLRSNI